MYSAERVFWAVRVRPLSSQNHPHPPRLYHQNLLPDHQFVQYLYSASIVLLISFAVDFVVVAFLLLHAGAVAVASNECLLCSRRD
jgi:hypothetical protein